MMNFAAKDSFRCTVGYGRFGDAPYNRTMARFTAELIPDTELGGFTARIPDIPAYGEGETEAEAISDLKQALRAYIEAFGLEDALSRLNAPSVLRHVVIGIEPFVDVLGRPWGRFAARH